MTDSKETTPTKTEQISFTEKEERVLKVAWSCLKSGPPEVDLAKLTVAAGFNTQKTAANTWGTVKKKLAAMTLVSAEGGDGTATSTPTKSKATPKKRASNKAVDVDDEEDESPTKKRKTPAKKRKVVKAEEDADAGDFAEAVKDVSEE